ncbi:helix-turn-helix domain-containing protein [Streptococcus sp. DD04]|uniref:helix-turn-helix domain-containing protein n=1 Tax=Streptococcus sp. DD04 TaxID=1776578 RepID=UPI00078351A5|nr:helix-turn-helix transcriptional regulator [Streptococcus sp. DD04]KXT66820.1 Phage DNA-binding protein [Streptococcus sp. DD04]
MNRLKELRQEKKVSQKAIAEMLAVNEKTVSRWENGESNIKPEKAQQLADYFGVSVGYLLGYSDFKTPEDFLDSREIVHHEEVGDIIELKANPIELLTFNTIGEKRIDDFYSALINIANIENKKFGLGAYSSKEEAHRDINHLINNISSLPEDFRDLLVYWTMGTNIQRKIVMDLSKEFANSNNSIDN